MTDFFTIDDFSGGKTDFPFNTTPNKFEQAHNVLIDVASGKPKFVLRPGSDHIVNGSNVPARIPEGSQRISNIFTMGNQGYYQGLCVHTAKKLYTYNIASGSFTNSNGVNVANPVFFYADANYYLSTTAYNNNIMLITAANSLVGGDWPIVLFDTGATNKTSYTAGLPQVNTSGITTVLGAGMGSYLVKLVYRSQFSSGGKTYVLKSDPVLMGPYTNALTMNNLPNPPTQTDTHYPLFGSTGSIEIYRTVQNGTVFYLESTINAPTTTALVGNVADATLQTNQRLYTEGGVFGNTKPPRCELVHIVNGNAYYARYLDSSGNPQKNSILQSIPGIPWGVPSSFNSTIDDEVVGLSSAAGHLLILCVNGAYRIDGLFDSFGRGGMVPQKISDSCSCVSAQSVVQTDTGIFWAGREGIYFSDGFNVKLVNIDTPDFWSRFVGINSGGADGTAKNKYIQGRFDQRNSRVWFSSIYSPQTGSSKYVYAVLDTRFGISDRMPITTQSNNTLENISNTSQFKITASYFDPQGSILLRADDDGYLYAHSESLITDRGYYSGNVASPLNNTQVPIVYDIKTAAIDFGNSSSVKYVPRLTINSEHYATGYFYAAQQSKMDMYSINDGGKTVTQLDTMSYTPTNILSTPVDVPPISILPTAYNFKKDVISKWRHFPRTALRCVFKQLEFMSALETKMDTVVVTCSGTHTVSLPGPTTWAQYGVRQGDFAFISGVSTPIYIANISGLVMTLASAHTTSGAQTVTVKGYFDGPWYGLNGFGIQFSALGSETDAYKSIEG